jgi:hypothetical protein
MRINDAYMKLPLRFEANQGQTDQAVRYISRGPGYSLFLTSAEAVLALSRHVKPEGKHPNLLSHRDGFIPTSSAEQTAISMRFLGSDSEAEVKGEQELLCRVNYFKGNDPAKWRTDVPTYSRVKYKGIYPGIDLLYYGNQQQLEYDFVVGAGTDPTQIRFAFEGADKPEINADGELVLHTPLGEVHQKKPLLYQEEGGVRREVAGRYVVGGAGEVSFEVGEYDRGKELVIDPVLLYSTYLGGNDFDGGLGIAVDKSGLTYVSGFTDSTNFPTRNQFQSDQPSEDAFVTVLDTSKAGDASLLYSTYLGGSGFDSGGNIAVDKFGRAYVAGFTDSTDFPTRNPFQATKQGGDTDAFVTVLDTRASGDASLVYSTYLGGSSDEFGGPIAVDKFGRAYVTGGTDSANFPTRNPFQGELQNPEGIFDDFVTVLDTTVSGEAGLVYSTYLGGSSDEDGTDIAVDEFGRAYVAGETLSSDFPTRNQFQGAGGDFDTTVTVLDTRASGDASLLYSTYLSGSNEDAGRGIAVDKSGLAYVSGFTRSVDFPTRNAFQDKLQNAEGETDAFVTVLDPKTSGDASLVYSTYLGGSSRDGSAGIAVDKFGLVYVTGDTASTDFPTRNPIQGAEGDLDAFVTVLDTREAGQASLIFSTHLGGSGRDDGRDIAIDKFGRAYITGSTASTDFPTMNAQQPDFGGPLRDAYVSVIDICDSKQHLNNGNDKKCNDSNGSNISNINRGSSMRPPAVDAVGEISRPERGMTFQNRLRRRHLTGW